MTFESVLNCPPRFEILAKNEMKELAETTSDSNRSILEKGTFTNEVAGWGHDPIKQTFVMVKHLQK